MEQKYQWKGGALASGWIQDGENLFVQNWVQNMSDLSDFKPYKKKFLILCLMWPSELKRTVFLLSDHNKQSSHKRWVRHSRKVSQLLKIPEKNSESWRQPEKTLLTSSEKYAVLCLMSDQSIPQRKAITESSHSSNSQRWNVCSPL